MKRFIGGLLTIAALVSLAACGGGNEKSASTVDSYRVLCGFEDYREDMTLNSYANMVGTLKLSEDSAFVTEGRKSLRMDIDNSSNISWIPHYSQKFLNAPSITFYSSRIGLGDLSTVEYFALDVFNENDREVSVYLQCTDETDKVIFGKLKTISAGKMSTAIFDVNADFETSDWQRISKITIGIIDLGLTESSCRLYLDNFGYRESKEKKEYAVSRVENEVASFADESFLTLIDPFYATKTPVFDLKYSMEYRAAEMRFAGICQVGTEMASLTTDVQRAGISLGNKALEGIDWASAGTFSFEVMSESEDIANVYVQFVFNDGTPPYTVMNTVERGRMTRLVLEKRLYDFTKLEEIVIFMDINKISEPCSVYIRNIAVGR